MALRKDFRDWACRWSQAAFTSTYVLPYMAQMGHTVHMTDEIDVTEQAIRAAIRARRAAIGVTNAELADRAGISLRTLNHYVQGESKLYIGPLIQLAGALDTTVEELLRDALELIERGLLGSEAEASQQSE